MRVTFYPKASDLLPEQRAEWEAKTRSWKRLDLLSMVVAWLALVFAEIGCWLIWSH